MLSDSTQRKETERDAYQVLYSRGENTGVTPFRSQFFSDSEEIFDKLVEDLSSGSIVLEIGSGVGKHSCIAATRAKKVYATDVSEEGLKIASAEASRLGVQNKIEFQVADAERLAYPDKSFDLIVNHEVFSSIDLDAAFPELHRVLKDGGLILSKETLGHNVLFNLKRKLNELRGKRTKWAVSHIWREENFSKYENLFRLRQKKYFHLLVLFLAPLYFLPWNAIKKPIITIAQFLDNFLLKIPFIQRQAFKQIFILEKN